MLNIFLEVRILNYRVNYTNCHFVPNLRKAQFSTKNSLIHTALSVTHRIPDIIKAKKVFW